MLLFASIVLAVILVGTYPAVAQGPRVNPATVDVSQKARLTVVKSAGDPFTQYGDPTNPLANTQREPIPGIAFVIRKVEGVDLTTNDGWRMAQEMKAVDFYTGGQHANKLGSPITQTTDATGSAVFSNLELGLYYVAEDASSAQENHLTISEPFLVTLPHTDVTRTSWMYELTVNPKNQKLRAVMDVQQKCFRKSERIEYGISANAPAVGDNEVLDRYELVDPLPQGTRFVADSSTVHLSTPQQARSFNVTELGREDYTIHAEGSVVHMELAESGLKKLSDVRRGNPAAQVTWRYFLAFDAVTEDTVTNKGYLLVDGYPSFDLTTTPGVPTNPVVINRCPGTETTTPTPVPPSTTPSVPTPGQPVPPTTSTTPPGAPDVPQLPVPVPGPDAPPEPTPSPVPQPIPEKGGLAETGANTMWVFAGGALLVIAGCVFLLRGRRAKDVE